MRNLGNIVIKIKEISITLIFSDGPTPEVDEDDFLTAEGAFVNAEESFNELQKTLFKPPSRYNFDPIEYQAYLLPADEDWSGLDQDEIDNRFEIAETYNAMTDDSSSDRLAAYIRLFCQVSVLFFLTISVG